MKYRTQSIQPARLLVQVLTVSLLSVTGILPAQTAGPAGSSSQVVRPIGVVTAIDVTAKQIALETDAGPELTVLLQDSTNFLRVPPGVKDLKGATKIGLADVIVGDRILVRGKLAEDQKSIPAASVVVMTKGDIAKKHEADRAQWQRRGVLGRIEALRPAAKEITIETRTQEGRKPITLALAPDTELRRYAPDSVRFSDARPSTFDALKVGDEVRALGNRSEDGSRYTAEEIVSGSFRNVAGTVISVSEADKVVRITNLETKRPLAVKINSDSTLRKLPPQMAQMIAMRLRGGTGSGGNGPAGIAAPAKPLDGGATSAPGPRGPDGGSGGRNPAAGVGRIALAGVMRGAGGAPDFSQILERLPVLALADLKPGDAVVVASTVGTDPAQATAITLLAGVEPLLTAGPGSGQQTNLGSWNLENMNVE